MSYISEIFTISIYLQEIYRRESVNFGENFLHIITFTEVQIINLSQVDVTLIIAAETINNWQCEST